MESFSRTFSGQVHQHWYHHIFSIAMPYAKITRDGLVLKLNNFKLKVLLRIFLNLILLWNNISYPNVIKWNPSRQNFEGSDVRNFTLLVLTKTLFRLIFGIKHIQKHINKKWTWFNKQFSLLIWPEGHLLDH